MSGKILKAQFNEICLAGLELKNDRAVMYSGVMQENIVEVTNHGVNIQTTGAGRITLNTTQLYGPGFMYASTPADFLPLAHAFLPSKTITPILEILNDFRAINQFGCFVILKGGVL
jgi:hypothetical protein